MQGESQVFATMPYTNHDDIFWKASVQEGSLNITIEECYDLVTTNDGYSNSMNCGDRTNFWYEKHVPKVLAMSNKELNTLVVGFPDYVLLTPSSSPSVNPTITPNPSSAPTDNPTRSPTISPVARRTRKLVSEPDRYGSVGIYSYQHSDLNTFPHETDWENSSLPPYFLHGISPNGEFGEGIAISDDGLTVAVGSPGDNLVQVFAFSEGAWEKRGQDIVHPFGNDVRFGHRLGLSADGISLAIAAPLESNSEEGYDNAGAVFVYDFDSTEDSWERTSKTLYGGKDDLQIGAMGVVIDNVNAKVHVVDSNGDRHSYLLRVSCSDPFALHAQSSLPFQFQCRCSPGYLGKPYPTIL